jgi:hypothetical protein
MATLLRPFVWQGVFIPILPAGLIEVIESPVPYLVGVQRLEGERLRTVGECLVVNCNTKSLLLPPVLPPFPFDAKLYQFLLLACVRVLWCVRVAFEMTRHTRRTARAGSES